MSTRIHRSIDEPIRQMDLDFDTRWRGPDRGLILCWENGRRMRIEKPDLAAKAETGELIMLAWKGGVTKKLKDDKKEKSGTWNYLATWQGLRGEDLDVAFESDRTIVCTKTGQAVVFSSRPPEDEDEE